MIEQSTEFSSKVALAAGDGLGIGRAIAVRHASGGGDVVVPGVDGGQWLGKAVYADSSKGR